VLTTVPWSPVGACGRRRCAHYRACRGHAEGIMGNADVAMRRKHGGVVRKHGDGVRTFLGEPVQAKASQGELTRTRASQCEPERAADDGVARGGFFGFY
jgi:hypothetical protein